MPVAALLGLGWPGLLATMGATPVVAGRDIVVMGARDRAEAADIGDLPDRLGLTVYGPERITAGPAALGAGRPGRRTGCTSTSTYWTKRSSRRPTT